MKKVDRCKGCGIWVDADLGDCEFIDDKPYCEECYATIQEERDTFLAQTGK